jgi:hypothetical protein
MDEIIVRFKWITAQKWHSRTSTRRPFRIALWAIALLLLVPGFLLCIRDRDWYGIWLIVPSLVFLGSLKFLTPWIIRYRFRHRPDNGADIEWRICSDSIHIQSAHSVTDIKWNSFWRIVQCPDGFLFYPFSQLFYWLPRHSFQNESDIQQLADYARASGVPFQIIS